MNILMTDSDEVIKFPYSKVYKSAFLDPFSGNSFFRFDDYSGFLTLISILKENSECDLCIDLDRNRKYESPTVNDVMYESHRKGIQFKGHEVPRLYELSFHYIPMGYPHSDELISKYYAENKDKSKLIPSWFYQLCTSTPFIDISKIFISRDEISNILDTFDRMNMNGYAFTRFCMMTWNPLSTVLPALLEGIK